MPALAHADVTDVLVTALRIAVTRWFTTQGRASDLLIDLERHGREELAAGVDLSRTVGWFTNITPVRLPGGTDGVDALKSVKEALRAAPDGGIGYGMLRYANARTAGLLAAGSPAQVLFNYLGRMPAGQSGPWTGATETDSLATDPDTDMGGPYRLLVNALCEDTPDGPVLRTVFGWSEPDLSADDAHAISDGWVAALRELVASAARHDGRGALTPSDVPLAPLTQAELDVVVAAAPGGSRPSGRCRRCRRACTSRPASPTVPTSTPPSSRSTSTGAWTSTDWPRRCAHCSVATRRCGPDSSAPD